MVAAAFISGAGNKGTEPPKVEVKIPKEFKDDIPIDYRSKFKRISSFEKSALHWNLGIVIYCNTCLKAYLNNYIEFLREFEADEDEEEELKLEYKTYPVGTVIVKDHFQLNAAHFVDSSAIPSAPSTIAVMVKKEKGFDPTHGDWLYGYFGADGKMIASGKAANPAVKALCSDCHNNIKERDYIFSRRTRSDHPK